MLFLVHVHNAPYSQTITRSLRSTVIEGMSSLNDANPTRKDLKVKLPQPANVKIENPFILLQIDAEQTPGEELQVGKVLEPPKQKTIPAADPAENLLGSGLEDQVQQCAMDSAICQFPRMDQLWYKYIHMEEMQGNVEHAREIFERWMRWMPDHQAWLSFIDFELRYNQVGRARAIFEHLVRYHPKQAVRWIQYAKFEIKNGEVARARNVYGRAVEKIALDGDEELKLYIDFAEFEEQCKEIERARCICKFMLDHVPTERRPGEFYSNLVHFEEQYGEKLIDSGSDGKKDEGFKLRRSKRIKEATGEKKL